MKFSKREKIFTALFLVVLSLTFFVNTVPVKADAPEFIITVSSYQLYVYDYTYDTSGNGEFVFQCSFESDKSPNYKTGEWSMSTYTLRTVTTFLHAEAMDDSDYVYFKLYECDGWPNPDDVVIDWQSVQVSNLAWGSSHRTFYDGEGLYCKFLVTKADNPYH